MRESKRGLCRGLWLLGPALLVVSVKNGRKRCGALLHGLFDVVA